MNPPVIQAGPVFRDAAPALTAGSVLALRQSGTFFNVKQGGTAGYDTCPCIEQGQVFFVVYRQTPRPSLSGLLPKKTGLKPTDRKEV